MPGNCPAQFSPCSSPVENIPFQGERHSGKRQKVFAFPPEWVFAFRTECCSESQRNGVRLQNGIAFAFDRIPQPFSKMFLKWREYESWRIRILTPCVCHSISRFCSFSSEKGTERLRAPFLRSISSTSFFSAL